MASRKTTKVTVANPAATAATPKAVEPTNTVAPAEAVSPPIIASAPWAAQTLPSWDVATLSEFRRICLETKAHAYTYAAPQVTNTILTYRSDLLEVNVQMSNPHGTGVATLATEAGFALLATLDAAAATSTGLAVAGGNPSPFATGGPPAPTQAPTTAVDMNALLATEQAAKLAQAPSVATVGGLPPWAAQGQSAALPGPANGMSPATGQSQGQPATGQSVMRERSQHGALPDGVMLAPMVIPDVAVGGGRGRRAAENRTTPFDDIPAPSRDAGGNLVAAMKFLPYGDDPKALRANLNSKVSGANRIHSAIEKDAAGNVVHETVEVTSNGVTTIEQRPKRIQLRKFGVRNYEMITATGKVKGLAVFRSK